MIAPLSRLLVLALVALLCAHAHAAEKELRMALISAPPSLGNPFGGIGPPASVVWNAVFDPLTVPGESGELEPWLALSWEPVAPTRWRFKLRPGVVFANGEPFDAQSVVTAVKWLIADAGRRSVVGVELYTVKDVVAVDAMTVDILTDTPDAILPKRLTAAAMVPPKYWSQVGVEGFAQAPVGTGPFAVKTWQDRGGRIVLEANRASWRRPRIDRIVFFITSDSVARVQSLLSGRIDVVNIISPDLAAQFEGTDFRVVVSPTPQVYAIAFDAMREKSPALRDVRVRQALNYAVNKDAISQIVMRGTMRSASQGATPVTFGYNPALAPYPHDPAKARALLAAAGYGAGLKLSAEVVTNGMAGDAGALPLVQQDLRAVGVDLEIRSAPFADWLRKYTSHTFDVDMFGLSWNGAPYYDAQRALEYHSCAKVNPFFCEPSVMPLYEAVGKEFDVEKRRRLLQDLAARVRDLAPALFLYEATDISVIAPAVKNYQVRLRVPVYEAIDIER